MSGIMERLRRFSGRGGEPDTPKSPQEVSSPKANPWRGVFDPNSNPNVKGVGRSYYDTVEDPKSAKTTWDYHLQAEKAAAKDVKEAAFKAMGASSSGDVLDAQALRKMFASDRVDQIMAAADKNKDGKIDFKEFCELIRRHPCD